MPVTAPTPFRPDIAGLRAGAVLAVVLFHFGVPGFGGGFVGVDSFFVISGFLMTQIIARGLEGDSFSLWRFYFAWIQRTCYEYSAFNCVASKALQLRIRPLIRMACKVMVGHCLALGTNKVASTKFLQLKTACNAVGRCFTLLWNNSLFDDAMKRMQYSAVLDN